MENEQLTFEFQERPTIKGFPELRWTGKRPYRSTQYYPAQIRERYGEEQDGWINKIFWGDNLQVMSHLMRDFRGKIYLIYIDGRGILGLNRRNAHLMQVCGRLSWYSLLLSA